MSRLLSVYEKTSDLRSAWMMRISWRVAVLALVLISFLARNSAFADDGQTLKIDESEISTIGEDSVDPIVINGQVIDSDSKPASKCRIEFRSFAGRSAASEQPVSLVADEEGRFRVRLRLKNDWIPSLKVSVVGADNSQVGYYRFPWGQKPSTEPIQIQLVAARNAQLKVIDKTGTPIQKANTSVQLGYPLTTDPIQTDAEGIARFVIPVNEKIIAVVAWKDDTGLDYHLYQPSRAQTADLISKPPEFPESGMETLVLEGATPVSVKLVDDDDAPIKNAGVYPWLLKKDSETDELNLSLFMQVFVQKTNDEGITTFSWMPTWQTGLLQFWPQAPGYDHQRGTYTPGKDKNPLTMTIKKLVPIKGHVRDAAGLPVSGVNISANGEGYTFDHGRATTASNEDGSYELLVPPDQIYLVVASAKGLASAPHSGFAVFKGEPVSGKDFVLRAATRIHGKLLDEETQQPVPKGYIYVYQYGQDLHSMKEIALPNPEKSRKYVRPLMVYSTQSDENGQFELFIGDGNFDIRPPQQEKAEKFEIAGDAEREFALKTKMSKQVELMGIVKDQATNLPLAGAVVQGISRSHGGRDWQAKSDPKGEFRVKHFPAGAFVFARSSDKKLGAIVEIESNQPSVTLSLQPIGTARGRLLKTDTKEPWGGQKVLYGVRVPDENNRTWSNRFGGNVTTAEDGTFELAGLVPGWKYDMQMDYRSDGTIPSLGEAIVDPDETKDIGDVSPAPPPKPYVAPTLEEQIQTAFKVEGTATERLLKAKDLIRLVNQHLLIVFGVPDDLQVRRLMRIRFEDEDFRPFSDDFRFMAIPTDEKHRSEADKLASILSESLEGDRSKFLIVMLDSNGKKVGTAAAGKLADDGTLSRKKLLEWLGKYRIEPKDARKMLEDALIEAEQQNKRVLVQETATWCGPCISLSRFLSANRVWEKDYIWVKLDQRYSNVQEVMAELREGAQGGIPWFAILDSEGKILTTSNDQKTKQNIGYPGNDRERAHFEKMLKSTRQKMTDDEIAGLIEILASDKK